jgi:hypothetical protein
VGSRRSKRRTILQHGRTPGSYTAWPHACAKSDSYRSLSPHAKALLLDFLGQFTGFNNGDLCCAFKPMKKCGWKSRTTVEKARAELEQKGWIVRTRQGWRHKPNLYALTMFKIDDIPKLDVRQTATAPGFWQDGRNPWLDDQKSVRPKGAAFSSTRSCATPAPIGTRAGHLAPEIDQEVTRVA